MCQILSPPLSTTVFGSMEGRMWSKITNEKRISCYFLPDKTGFKRTEAMQALSSSGNVDNLLYLFPFIHL